MSQDRKKTHPLAFLHLLAMMALLFWWSIYFWRHSPARDIFLELGETGRSKGDGHVNGAHLGARLGETLSSSTAHASEALQAAIADVAGGSVVLILFGIATGVYVRRFEIWLQARGTGEAMMLAGSNLSDKALAANTVRRVVTK